MKRPDARHGVVLDVLDAHRYLYDGVAPGWNSCSCGWQGYWSQFNPHVADCVVEALGDL